MTEASIPPFIRQWHDGIEPVPLTEVLAEPHTAAIFSADMIVGFLRTGALASERVNSLTAPVVDLISRSWNLGLRDVVLLQDTHSPETPEFEAYPRHCVAGTEESQTIPEIASLPFADHFTIIEKNSLNPAIGTIFDDWLTELDHIRTAIVVGNCTDLCTYQLAMHLRMRANALDIAGFEVIVAEDCVTTFDLDSHPADFFHAVFLYHMASNGIRIVSSLA
jgi:nicotinamidase-related amidase